MPIVHRQDGNVAVEVEVNFPLPRGSAVVYCRRSPAHCRHAVWQCRVGNPILTAPMQSDNVLHEFQCPMPLGRMVVCGKSSTAHCPRAVRQGATAGLLPTAPSQCASVWH